MVVTRTVLNIVLEHFFLSFNTMPYEVDLDQKVMFEIQSNIKIQCLHSSAILTFDLEALFSLSPGRKS